MAVRTRATKKSGGARKRRSSRNGKTAKRRIEKLVAEAIDGIEKRLTDADSPPTIGDYLKVMQLQKEIEEEMPKEIKVTWIEPENETTPESGR